MILSADGVPDVAISFATLYLNEVAGETNPKARFIEVHLRLGARAYFGHPVWPLPAPSPQPSLHPFEQHSSSGSSETALPSRVNNSGSSNSVFVMFLTSFLCARYLSAGARTHAVH